MKVIFLVISSFQVDNLVRHNTHYYTVVMTYRFPTSCWLLEHRHQIQHSSVMGNLTGSELFGVAQLGVVLRFFEVALQFRRNCVTKFTTVPTSGV